MIRALAIAALLASAAPASANVWQQALDEGVQDEYDKALATGDGYALQANAASQTAVTVSRLVDLAVDQYDQAAKLRPSVGEPYFRIASTLESFYTDCPTVPRAYRVQQHVPQTCPDMGRMIDLSRAKQAVSAWEAFEARAPLDPRISEALFSRAILRTKLVEGAKDPKPLLVGALSDYLALLDRNDGLSASDPDQVWGNLAETYMMLGRMEEAIDAYREALKNGANASTAYGLAVALDRDGSPSEALDTIRAHTVEGFNEYRRLLALGAVFYVPRGEEHYYLALIFEAFESYRESLAEWRAFIASKAHPQFLARAKQHVDAITAKLKAQPQLLHREFDPFPID